MIEALISIMLAGLFMAALASISYVTSTSSYKIDYSNAAYDFISMYYYNDSAFQCISSMNSRCAAALLEKFAVLYGLDYMGITGSTTVHYGNASHCNNYYRECFITKTDYSIDCIDECGS